MADVLNQGGYTGSHEILNWQDLMAAGMECVEVEVGAVIWRSLLLECFCRLL